VMTAAFAIENCVNVVQNINRVLRNINGYYQCGTQNAKRN
jgi:hypothetical protein